MPAWRNWQTRLIQNQVPFGSGGSSPLAGTLRAREMVCFASFFRLATASTYLAFCELIVKFSQDEAYVATVF